MVSVGELTPDAVLVLTLSAIVFILACVWTYMHDLKEIRLLFGLEDKDMSEIPIDISEDAVQKHFSTGVVEYKLKIDRYGEFQEVILNSKDVLVFYDNQNKLVAHKMGRKFRFDIHLPHEYKVNKYIDKHIPTLSRLYRGSEDYFEEED